MASFSEITINSRSPFTEEVKIACNPHVNLFIGTNGTGKSTLIRHIKNRSHSYPCVMIPPNRLALPRSPDDDGHSDLIRGINDVKDIAEALVDNQTTFDSRRVYYVKTMMRNRLLTENGSAELADSYFKALSLSYSCAQQICGELLSPHPPEDYTWQKTFLVNETVTMPSGAATTRQREAGTATNVYSRMGLSVTHRRTVQPQGNIQQSLHRRPERWHTRYSLMDRVPRAAHCKLLRLPSGLGSPAGGIAYRRN